MQTLQAITNPLRRVNGNYISKFLFADKYYNGISWGKCVINDENKTVEFMQTPGSCKDYVVDTRYRNVSNGWDKYLWTQEEIEYPSVYFWMSSPMYDRITQKIKEILNPWEEKNGFLPSETLAVNFNGTQLVDKTNTEKHVLILKFDPVWMQNSMCMSFFLSVVRHAILQEKIQFKDITNTEYSKPEHAYRDRLVPECKQVIDYTIDNPRTLLEFTKDSNAHGYKVNPQTHGCTGLFYIFNPLVYKYHKDYAESDTLKRCYPAVCSHILTAYADHVLELLSPKKEELPDVKMQSLQPKVTKPRTHKTTPKSTTTLIWPTTPEAIF